MEWTATHVYLVSSGNADRLGQVWRSPKPAVPAAPVFEWTKIFDLTGGITTPSGEMDGGVNSYFREQSFALGPDGSACVLEYGATIKGGPSVYYSPNAASASPLWTKRQTFTDSKHGHGIKYINDGYWAMLGDAGFTNVGLWKGGQNGAGWQRRSVYEPAQGGNSLYGINLLPCTINGAQVILTDNDTKRGHSILMFPTQGAGNFPLIPFVNAPLPYGVGTVRSLAFTSEGNLFWVQTGEGGSAGPYDSMWLCPPPFREPVMLEAIPANNSLSTLGLVVESGDYLFVGNQRIRKEKFLGQ
ncbi:hypothetical protein [Paeniglutamicibacter sulfureus]